MAQQHYDVFISFKNTAADGTQSVDAQLASEIYKNLTERGISAFYSNVKLLELGEATYKKAIEDALDQSSILVCILSCKERIDKSAAKGIAAANAVNDMEVI